MSGKIYKLSLPDGSYYFGSTFYSMEERLSYHKTHSKTNLRRKVYKRVNELGGWDSVICELIQEHSNVSDRELRDFKDEFIKPNLKDPLCLNHSRNHITEKERLEYFKQYKIDNADEIKLREILRNKTEKRIAYKKQYTEDHKQERSQNNKEYRALHAEDLKAKRLNWYDCNRDKLLIAIKEKTTCECGGIFRKRDIRRHERSVMHQTWFTSQQS